MSELTSIRTALDETSLAVWGELLARRNAAGHWAGELSSSALSTATAVTALHLVEQARQGPAVPGGETAPDPAWRRGWDWLAANVNADGGWGDTLLSRSNLSTTALGWAALGLSAENSGRHADTVEHAGEWIKRRTGALTPEALVPALIARYGDDQTFSIPILTHCALAGRLGQGRDAWRSVLQLPFELAAFPPRWFAALRLPVVSYALPALIAIGHVRHHWRPTRNPVARLVRELVRAKTLRVLEKIQPPNGGFLEATPLTSFVTMSLAGCGLADHPVARRGAEFLRASQRADGSWPIDTNLATWLTTLAIHALPRGQVFDALDRPALRRWLLGQQYRARHPYTNAAPGGWAWTDLPGGVPDADDTAGALLALARLGPLDDELKSSATMGIQWLLDLQNRDGGVPTFCRGWGRLPFDRSSADITAHAVRAWLVWLDALPGEPRRRTLAGLQAALNFLSRAQRDDGAWLPLWFGNEAVEGEVNPTYGTARVLLALAAIRRFPALETEVIRRSAARGWRWLRGAQNVDGGWGGGPGTPSTTEETSLVLEAVAAELGLAERDERGAVLKAMTRGVEWLRLRVKSGTWQQPAPIGFYFARLWYFERLYPVVFAASALARVAEAIESERAAG